MHAASLHNASSTFPTSPLSSDTRSALIYSRDDLLALAAPSLAGERVRLALMISWPEIAKNAPKQAANKKSKRGRSLTPSNPSPVLGDIPNGFPNSAIRENIDKKMALPVFSSHLQPIIHSQSTTNPILTRNLPSRRLPRVTNRSAISGPRIRGREWQSQDWRRDRAILQLMPMQAIQRA